MYTVGKVFSSRIMLCVSNSHLVKRAKSALFAVLRSYGSCTHGITYILTYSTVQMCRLLTLYSISKPFWAKEMTPIPPAPPSSSSLPSSTVPSSGASSNPAIVAAPNELWVKHGNSRPVEVSCAGCKNVDYFIEGIKKKLEPKLNTLSVDDISLHLSETSDALDPGLCLLELPQQPGYVNNTSKTPLYVKTLSASAPSSPSSSEPSLQGREPHPHRLKRWQEINKVLNKNKNKKRRSEEDSFSPGYSYTRWNEVGPIFDSDRANYVESITPIPQEDLDTLSKVLTWIVKCFKSLIDTRGNEAKCLHLIAPILWSIVQLLPDVTIQIEQDLDGVWVDAHGHFEFILTHGNKCICIVEAKEEKFKQGMAQVLLGCEVMADLDNSDSVYGIVINFTQWIFLKSLDKQTLSDKCNSLYFEPIGGPSHAALLQIVRKLYSLLL